MKIYKIFFLLLISFLLAPSSFASRVKPLPLDQAFKLKVKVTSNEQITATWEIAPGYYLYRDRFAFEFKTPVVHQMVLPKGDVILKSNGREEEVFKDKVTIPLKLLENAPNNVSLKVNYQGCSSFGFCYPPTAKHFNLTLNASKTDTFTWRTLLTNQNVVRHLFQSQTLIITLLIFAGIGLLLAFTPCVFPMIPILTSIIVGHKQPVSTKKAFILSVIYVLGASIMYALAGLLAAYFGRSLQMTLQTPWVIVLFSGIFMLLALALFGVYEFRLPNRLQNKVTHISSRQQGGAYLSVFMMGCLSTLIVSPCVTAPLIGVLMYIAESGNPLLGASALFVMSLGMGLPLILIGVSAGHWLPKRGPWMMLTQKIFGILMVGMAAWLLSRVAMPIITALFCVVCLMIGGLYYLLERNAAPKLSHRLGFTGSFLMVMILTVGSVFYFKEAHKNVLIAEANSFQSVKNIDEISAALSKARASGKPVLLDFYADWCESCIIMEKTIFNNPKVIHQLSSFVTLRADLSQNNANDEAILKHYAVYAPPTVLFFNNQGTEVSTYRIVGELDEKAFTAHINTFFAAKCDQRIAC